MEKAMYKAAMEGNVEFLRVERDREIETGCWNKHFLSSLTPQKNNIIHIATQYDQYDFLKACFDSFNFSPFMIAKTNAKGESPLHVASKRGNKRIVEFLVDAYNKHVLGEIHIWKEFEGESRSKPASAEWEGDDHEEKRPWRVKNMEGNTPLHEALINGKLEVATFLVEVDPELAKFVNNIGETPLHLAIKYNVDDDKKLTTNTIELLNKQRARLPYRGTWLAKESLSIIELLLAKHNKDAVYVRDKNSLTPLLRAAVQSHFRAIEIILNECPDCLEMCDPMGKTILHLVQFQRYEEAKKFFQTNPQILNLKDQQDKMGNTPAHIAVMNCIEKISEERKAVLRDHDVGSVMKFLGYKDEHDVEENIFTDEHKVLRNHDSIGVIRALFESSTNFSIKNKEGLSAAALFQQLKSHFSCNNGPLKKLDMEIEDLVTENKCKQKQEKRLWKAVEDADVIFLRQEMDNLESCLKDGSLSITDLLYILLQACNTKHSDNPITKKSVCCYNRGHGRPTTTATGCCYNEVEDLMKKLFEKNPLLIHEINSRGDTPLHILARAQEHEISESFLRLMKKSYVKDDEQEYYCPFWRVKNVEGNTPLHEAFLHIAPSNGNVVRFLMECEPDVFRKCDGDVAVYLNNRWETPLHVFCRSEVKVVDTNMIKEIIEANKWSTLNRDAEGLTPLLRASENGKIEVVKQIWEVSPESAQLRDCKGRTFWHVMDMSGTTREDEKKLKEKVQEKGKEKIKALSSATDNSGITPLVQAIKDHNYNLAQVLSKITKKSVNQVLSEEPIGMRYTLFLLRFASHLHGKLEENLWIKMKNIGVKSIYGVPKSEINGYTNTIGVLAVLLATIAFQGAFAVPGGFDQNKGYPLLLDQSKQVFIIRASYWVFIVADILTMCLSMMVLFCLQWIITGDEKEKLVITDLSILLLNTAFITTMVALMMGVFASTYPVSRELAIFTLVVCTAVLVLLQKWIVMSPLQYVFLTGYLVHELIWSSLPCNKWCDKFDNKVNKSSIEGVSQ